MILYDAKGKEFNIPHTVDAKEWIASGKYFVVNPKSKTKDSNETEKSILQSLGFTKEEIAEDEEKTLLN